MLCLPAIISLAQTPKPTPTPQATPNPVVSASTKLKAQGFGVWNSNVVFDQNQGTGTNRLYFEIHMVSTVIGAGKAAIYTDAVRDDQLRTAWTCIKESSPSAKLRDLAQTIIDAAPADRKSPGPSSDVAWDLSAVRSGHTNTVDFEVRIRITLKPDNAYDLTGYTTVRDQLQNPTGSPNYCDGIKYVRAMVGGATNIKKPILDAILAVVNELPTGTTPCGP